MEDVWKGTETTERDGLDNMDWTEGHSDCRAGREEKSNLVAERSRETAEKTGAAEAERAGECICYNVFGARNVDNITGELGEVGKMAHLSCGPQRRGTEKS